MIGSKIISGILSAMASAAVGVVARVMTEEFFTRTFERATVATLRKMANATENTLDDQIVEDIAKRLGVE